MSQESNKDKIDFLTENVKDVFNKEEQSKEIENIITIHLDQFEKRLEDFWNWSLSLGSMSTVRSFDEDHEILMSDFKKLREELGK